MVRQQKLAGTWKRQPHGVKAIEILHDREMHSGLLSLCVGGPNAVYTTAQAGLVHAWDAAAATLVREMPVDTVLGGAAWSPACSVGHSKAATCCAALKGTILTGSSDRTVKQWRQSDGACVATFEGHTHAVLAILPCLPPPPPPPPPPPQTADFNGKRQETAAFEGSVLFLSASADRTAALWDVADSRAPLIRYKGHDDFVTCLAWGPHGGGNGGTTHAAPSSFFTGSNDATVKKWDLRSGECLLTLSHPGAVMITAP